MRNLLKSLVAFITILSLLLFPSIALADQQQVDGDTASPGNQNIVNLTCSPGATVNVNAQIVVQYSGNNHLSSGDNVTFVDAGAAQTTLPAGYSVSTINGTIPSPWSSGSVYAVPTLSAISFTAPAATGSFQYTVKWTETHSYGNKLTGSNALVINLTVDNTKVNVTFDQVGVNADFTGTVLTVDGANLGVSDLPKIFSWDIGSEHTFAYLSPLAVDSSKQYVWTSTSGLTDNQTGTLTVPDEGGNVTGNYKTQYYLTLASNPQGIGVQTGSGWYDAGDYASITTTNNVSPYFFAGWTTDDQVEIADQYALATTVFMDKGKIVTANYHLMTAASGGKTLGFWSNKNGQSLIDGADLAILSGLNLVNNDNTAFDPVSYTQLRTWLLNATAVNMRYMLSVQLAATTLSIANSGLDPTKTVWEDDGDLIFEPGEAEWTIQEIIDAANTELASPTTRQYQEYLKNLLDKINNNKLFFV